MFRYRKTRQIYLSTPKPKECPFCNVGDKKLVVKETKHAFVMKNIFGYDLWELRSVEDHLMVIPKRHVKSLQDLTPEEQADVIKLIAEYESRNYNVYARAVGSVQRTVPLHQHTHLIKTNNQQAKGSVFIKKPYLLIKF